MLHHRRRAGVVRNLIFKAWAIRIVWVIRHLDRLPLRYLPSAFLALKHRAQHFRWPFPLAFNHAKGNGAEGAYSLGIFVLLSTLWAGYHLPRRPTSSSQLRAYAPRTSESLHRSRL